MMDNAAKLTGALAILLFMCGFAIAPSVAEDNQVLQGYIRVIPKDTKVPIIITSTLSPELDREQAFSAKTAEPLKIGEATMVPAGSLVEGRIVQLEAGRAKRDLIVGLVCDAITYGENNIRHPVVADVATISGLLKVRRGLKYVVIAKLAGDSIFKPSRTGAHSSDPRSQFRYFDSYQVPKPFSRVPVKDVFVAKKKFDLRNGDELKLQLAEEFRISWPG